MKCIFFFRFQILKLRKSQSTEGLNGRVINFLSFDVVRFNNLMAFFHYLWKGPVEMIIFGYFIYQEIGYFGFIGVGFILCFVPIQSKIYTNTYDAECKHRTELMLYICFSLFSSFNGQNDGKLSLSYVT